MTGNTKARLRKNSTLPATHSRDALKKLFDQWVTEYKTPHYITEDPLQIPYRFAEDPKACELIAFMTALLSYGRRSLIIESVTRLVKIMGNDPIAFLEHFHPLRDAKLFQHFTYRFNTGQDIVFLLTGLQWAYQQFGSLEALFRYGLPQSSAHERADIKAGIANFLDTLVLAGGSKPNTLSGGLKFLLAHPKNGGACKRFNMFLRWMVRHDCAPEPRVDLTLWKSALSPADLIVPLDTHVLKMNEALNLTPLRQGNWKTAESITAVFRQFCPEDPIRYDYALFGFSLAQQSSSTKNRATNT